MKTEEGRLPTRNALAGRMACDEFSDRSRSLPMEQAAPRAEAV